MWLKHQFLNLSPFSDSMKPAMTKSKSAFLMCEFLLLSLIITLQKLDNAIKTWILCIFSKSLSLSKLRFVSSSQLKRLQKSSLTVSLRRWPHQPAAIHSHLHQQQQTRTKQTVSRGTGTHSAFEQRIIIMTPACALILVTFDCLLLFFLAASDQRRRQKKFRNCYFVFFLIHLLMMGQQLHIKGTECQTPAIKTTISHNLLNWFTAGVYSDSNSFNNLF